MEEKKELTESERKGLEGKIRELAAKAHAEARKRNTLRDSDFSDLTDKEIDIRELSEKNYRQMMFRTSALQCEYLRGMAQSLADIDFSLQCLCSKMGVDLKEAYSKATQEAEKQRAKE
jgi:hypothetical protein